MDTKKLKLTFYIFLLVSSTLNCTVKNVTNKSGIIVNRIRFFDPKSQEYIHNELYGPDAKIWFKGNKAIARTTEIRSTSYGGVETGREATTIYYTYVDLKKMLFYKYATFSDTAQIIQSYNKRQSDTVVYKFAWTFYLRKNWVYKEPFQNLPDTFINGRQLKRILIHKKSEYPDSSFVISTAYFDCAKKSTMFNLNQDLSEKIGCPMVGYYTKYSGAEIIFESDKLTKEELKVFEAWENNLKKYPVKQYKLLLFRLAID